MVRTRRLCYKLLGVIGLGRIIGLGNGNGINGRWLRWICISALFCLASCLLAMRYYRARDRLSISRFMNESTSIS
jgi:hypothetical protein